MLDVISDLVDCAGVWQCMLGPSALGDEDLLCACTAAHHWACDGYQQPTAREGTSVLCATAVATRSQWWRPLVLVLKPSLWLVQMHLSRILSIMSCYPGTEGRNAFLQRQARGHPSIPPRVYRSDKLCHCTNFAAVVLYLFPNPW